MKEMLFTKDESKFIRECLENQIMSLQSGLCCQDMGTTNKNAKIEKECKRLIKKFENAEKKITDDLKQQVRDALFDRGWKKHANIDDPMNGFSERIVSNFLEQHKQEIIDKAAKYLAEKLSRTKAVKDMLEEVGNEQNH